MTTKSKGSSVRQKLIDLSQKLDAQYQNIQTAFMIERLVARLVADPTLNQRLVFKGGFVGLRIYDSSRYTVDLDALLVKSDIESTLNLVRKMRNQIWTTESGFDLKNKSILQPKENTAGSAMCTVPGLASY